MKIVPLYNYIVKNRRDFINFLSDLEKQGLKDTNSYLFKWLNNQDKFINGCGYSFCITEDYTVKWGEVPAEILMNLDSIMKHTKATCASEYRNYKLLYYSHTKLIKYNNR